MEILRGALFPLGLWVAVSLTRAMMVYSVPGIRFLKWQLPCQFAPLSMEYSQALFSVTKISVAVLVRRLMTGAAGPSAFSTGPTVASIVPGFVVPLTTQVIFLPMSASTSSYSMASLMGSTSPSRYHLQRRPPLSLLLSTPK